MKLFKKEQKMKLFFLAGVIGFLSFSIPLSTDCPFLGLIGGICLVCSFMYFKLAIAGTEERY